MQIKIALLQYKCFSSSSAHYNPIIVLTIFCASNFASEYSTIKEKKKNKIIYNFISRIEMLRHWLYARCYLIPLLRLLLIFTGIFLKIFFLKFQIFHNLFFDRNRIVQLVL